MKSDLPVTEQFREEDFFKKEDEEFTLENSALENSSDASDFEKGQTYRIVTEIFCAQEKIHPKQGFMSNTNTY